MKKFSKCTCNRYEVLKGSEVPPDVDVAEKEVSGRRSVMLSLYIMVLRY